MSGRQHRVCVRVTTFGVYMIRLNLVLSKFVRMKGLSTKVMTLSQFLDSTVPVPV